MCTRLAISFGLFMIVFNVDLLRSQDYIDVTTEMGINHTYGSGQLGAGLSFIDFNQDGLDDLTFATNVNENVDFYQNNGSSFDLVSLNGINISCESKQVTWVDFDNDGDKDFYVTCHEAANNLFENDGNLNFTDITTQAGLDLIEEESYAASFADFDKDGDLDLYLVNRSFDNQRNSLFYINNGDKTFTEATATVGVEDIAPLPFGGVFLDYNDDTWLDIYIYMDKLWGNVMFKNNGDGTFSNVSIETGTGLFLYAMCVAPGDYDNDHDLDIYVTNTPDGNVLFANQGDGTFVDLAASAGVIFNGIGWGGNFLDLDNDMDLDLYVSGEENPANSNRSQLYINNGDGTFSHPTTELVGDDGRSYGNAVGDFNNDGFPDIAENNYGETTSTIWKNTNTTNNWLKIKLQGTISNRDGIGAKIEFYADNKKQIRYTYCGESFSSQNANHEIFGMASITLADSIVVNWPSGIRDVLYNVAANHEILIIEGDHPVGIDDPESTLYSLQTFSSGDILRINFNEEFNDVLELRIIQMNGQQLYHERLRTMQTSILEFDISSLPRGIFILELNVGGTYYSSEFSKY